MTGASPEPGRGLLSVTAAGETTTGADRAAPRWLGSTARRPPRGPTKPTGVMAAWLMQLRSRLLLPADAPAQQEAELAANQFRERLVALQEMQGFAGWLERRPQLGHDVFARGQPEVFGVSVAAGDGAVLVLNDWLVLGVHRDLHVVADSNMRMCRHRTAVGISEIWLSPVRTRSARQVAVQHYF